MAKYRKNPVVIDAIKFEDDSAVISAISEMSEDTNVTSIGVDYANNPPILKVYTLEGVMAADIGDYIIKGVNGECYPCKPDIFEKTYEPVGADD